ncbi:hypothetical protein [Kineosporia sp. A_224]|uniref:hypothetical protein n=1 Tax=Kineosporia sp. A_224 TaxID=1962180 RepID=UPI000B4C2051|nr:hypothetical protein [Kineosporia sp. A_224]
MTGNGRRAGFAEPEQAWSAVEAETVRRALAARQDRMDPGPAPWPALVRRRAAAVRRRRATWTAGLVAGALAVTGVASGVAGLGGLRGDPVAVPAAPAWAPRLDGPTVGSLARDEAFLAAVRARAADEDDLGDVRGPRVLVATDVEGSRLVLVAWSRSRGVQWLVGPAGAPAADLRLADGCAATDVCLQRYGLSWTVSSADTGGAGAPSGLVVWAGAGATTVVTAGNDVAADGTVRPHEVPAAERWPGVYVAPLASVAGRLDVSVRPADGSRPLSTGSYTGSSLDVDAWWAQAAAPDGAAAARGTGISDPAARGDLVTLAARVTGIEPAPGDGSRVVLADTAGDRATAVLVLRAPGGGWARVVAVRDGGGATVTAYAVEAFPAELDPGAVPVAWLEDGVVRAVGGTGATTVEVGTRQRNLGPVPLERVVTEVEVDQDPIFAHFSDAGDHERGMVDVARPWPESQILAGPVAGTR